MRRLLISLFVAIFPVLAVSARADVEVTTVTFHSKALDAVTTYIAVLPSPREEGKRYPVIYLLHGATGSYKDWTTNTTLTQELTGHDVIVVTPDGGHYGWYLDSPLRPQSRYESLVSGDLIADVDSRFPTVAEQRGRAIAGLSMGGHGALSLAAKHPDVYASASALSGILNINSHPGKWELDSLLGKLPEAEGEWNRHSVSALLDKFATSTVALFFDTGVSDVLAIDDNRLVHERLTNRGIAHTYREHAGAHTWTYWRDHVMEHVTFHEMVFQRLAAGGTTPAGRIHPDKFPDHYQERTLAFEEENKTRAASRSTSRPVVLLGSSTFEAIRVEQMFPGTDMVNRGISGDGIGLGARGLLHRLNCSVYDLNPSIVFIQNGTNDIAGTARAGTPTVEEVAQCFGEVVQQIRKRVPDAIVAIVSCTPTRDKYAPISPLIAKYNAQIRQYAEQGDANIRYVDVFPDLAAPDGLLDPRFSRDGLHLNVAGYAVLKDKMLSILQPENP